MVTQKTKVKRPYDPAVPVLSIYLEEKKKKPSNLKRYMHFSVHRSSTCNSQDMKATQIPING